MRTYLMDHAKISVKSLDWFSDETSYPMVVLDLEKNGQTDQIEVNGNVVHRRWMELTGNFSWSIDADDATYFDGPRLGDYVVCTSGMTIGKNDLFVREVTNGCIVEPFDFEFFEDPITLEKERRRARLHQLSAKVTRSIKQQEAIGATRRNVRAIAKRSPEVVELPHPDYRPYNRAMNRIIFAPPSHVIYWKDDGDAVLTFKKNGNWYLHGVGGKPYFGRSGLTWQLVASRLNVRFLPEGYILDSGAPCAFLRPGVDPSELLFILGWTCTRECSRLLKKVINHTMNIQSKDFERLPYPWWVDQTRKLMVIDVVESLLESAMSGAVIDHRHPGVQQLEHLFEMDSPRAKVASCNGHLPHLSTRAEDATGAALGEPAMEQVI